MYDIVKREIESVNGLGGGLGKDGAVVNNINTLTNTAATATTSVANLLNAIANNRNSKTAANNGGTTTNSDNSGNGSSNPYMIYNAPTEEKKTDYLPWLIGGGIALFGLFFLMNNNKRR